MTTLAERYPTHPRRRRVIVAVSVLLAVLGLAWLLWTATVRATPDVAGRIKSFQVVDDTRAEAVLTVDRRDPGKPARCQVFSQAVNYERVGELIVDVPAGTNRVTDVPISVKTFRRPTTVALDHCEAVG